MDVPATAQDRMDTYLHIGADCRVITIWLAALSNLSGSLGLLLGILIVSYIKPTEDGGVAILILMPTVFFSICGSIIGWIVGKKNKSNTKNA